MKTEGPISGEALRYSFIQSAITDPSNSIRTNWVWKCEWHRCFDQLSKDFSSQAVKGANVYLVGLRPP